jgi:hypothetical protein
MKTPREMPGHPSWPKRQGGGACECSECAAVRRERQAASGYARKLAMTRGYSQRQIDRAASYATDSSRFGTIEAAVAAAAD